MTGVPELFNRSVSKVSLVPALASLCLLAACGGEQESVVEDERSAFGEVLPGSISDDMLPLDHVRSQAPFVQARPNTEESAEEEPATFEEAFGLEGEAPDDPPTDAPVEPPAE